MTWLTTRSSWLISWVQIMENLQSSFCLKVKRQLKQNINLRIVETQIDELKKLILWESVWHMFEMLHFLSQVSSSTIWWPSEIVI